MHEVPSSMLSSGQLWGVGSLVVVRMAVVQVGDVRVGVHERSVFVAVGVASGHRRGVGVGVVAVVVAVLMLVHDRLVDMSVLVAGPEGQSDADDRYRNRNELGEGHGVAERHQAERLRATRSARGGARRVNALPP